MQIICSMWYQMKCKFAETNHQLEQLECLLRYPRHPMITHPSDSHQIASQNKTEVKVTNFKNNPTNSSFEILHLPMTHLLKLLDKMCGCEMDPIRTVGDTEQTQNAGQMDGYKLGYLSGQTDRRMDRWMDGVKPIYPTTNNKNNNFVVRYDKKKTGLLLLGVAKIAIWLVMCPYACNKCNKSDVKWWNTLSSLDPYTGPNSERT